MKKVKQNTALLMLAQAAMTAALTIPYRFTFGGVALILLQAVITIEIYRAGARDLDNPK